MKRVFTVYQAGEGDENYYYVEVGDKVSPATSLCIEVGTEVGTEHWKDDGKALYTRANGPQRWVVDFVNGNSVAPSGFEYGEGYPVPDYTISEYRIDDEWFSKEVDNDK